MILAIDGPIFRNLVILLNMKSKIVKKSNKKGKNL